MKHSKAPQHQTTTRKGSHGGRTAHARGGVLPGLPARLVAWRVVQQVAAGAFAEVALARELNRLPTAQQLRGADRGLATELAYGTVRQRRYLDAWLEHHGSVPIAKQPPTLRWLLHVGLYQLLFTRRIPAAAAVNISVELARSHGLSRLAPVVNGLLRAVERAVQQGCHPPLPRPPIDRLAVEHSLPNWLAEALLGWLPRAEAEDFAVHANRPPTIDLRVNPLRGSRDQVASCWPAEGLRPAPVAMAPQALTLPPAAGAISELPGYRAGLWSVQDRAAQLVAPLLEPQPGHLVLDLCAAPGGKTTHLAELMGDRGQVVAIDRSATRLARLRHNALRLGLRSIQLQEADARHLPVFHGRADRVLLDAPCSGLGTLARNADSRWRMTPAAIQTLQALQRELLEEALKLLKPGGRLVYATCTVHPAENSQQIGALLHRHPQWQECPLPPSLRDLCHHPTRLQLWPHRHSCDGFFAVALEARG